MQKNKVAVVTGANKGLGYAIVKGLCSKTSKLNGKVYLTSRDERRGQNACEELKKLGFNPAFHQLDVTDGASITKFCNYMKDQHKQIDFLINNAGILFLKDAQEPKEYQVEQTLSVNFFALVNFTEAMLPLLKNGGSIINIASSSGHLSRIPSEELRKRFSSGDLSLEELTNLMTSYVEAAISGTEVEQGWGDSPYVVSKVGVNAYTFMLHRRLQEKDITVNSVHPGYVMSDMTRGGGSVTPAEAANMVLEVLERSEGGRFIWHNGAEVPWDGPDPRGYIDGIHFNL